MVTYKNIEEANSKMAFLDLKGKPYAMVPQRVKAFRMLYPEGFIKTEILSHENNIVLMKSEVGFFNDSGERVVLGTGMAYEEKGKGLVNGTSYIENCETSAVGRALGFLALGVDGGGICSAEELVNAIKAQEKNAQGDNKQAQKQAQRPAQQPVKAQVTTSATVPPTPPADAPKPPDLNTAKGFLQNEMAYIGSRFGLDKKEAGARFQTMRNALIAGGLVEDIKSEEMTLEQAKTLVAVMHKEYLDEMEQTA